MSAGDQVIQKSNRIHNRSIGGIMATTGQRVKNEMKVVNYSLRCTKFFVTAVGVMGKMNLVPGYLVPRRVEVLITDYKKSFWMESNK